MDQERFPLVPCAKRNPKKEVYLRVTPTEVKFLDTVVGRVYRFPITVHNIGHWLQKVRFEEPLKPQFKLLLNNLEKELAAGLYMTVMIEYHPDKNEDVYDQLIINACNTKIEIPLMGLIPSCDLDIPPEVNFGSLVANSKVHSKEISIRNFGKSPGTFYLEYTGGFPILVSPLRGTVKPQSSVPIKIEFCADKPLTINEVARVSMQGRSDVILTIKADVVEQIIELLNMSADRRIECIRFGSVFFGTSRIEHALLYNNSPEAINWVAIMQDDAVGEELGTNVRQRTDIALNNLTYIPKAKAADLTSFISCIPNEGFLSPYEKIEITLCFSPKLVDDGKVDIDASHRQDYALFLRFESIGSKDSSLKDYDNEMNKNQLFQRLELAVTGSGLPVLLQFDPKTLNFAPCVMGEHSEILCVMQNQSQSLPVIYRFQRTAHFKIDPEKGKIDEGCIQNVTCSFTPRHIGSFQVKQTIEIIGLVADKSLQTLSMKPFHYIHLDFTSVCKPRNKRVLMKVNPGISPLVSNPTGQFVIEDFAKRKDFAPVAMLQSCKTNLHTHQANKDAVKNALIAFPNDRAASIRPGEPYKDFRTIFTKTPRHYYVDPDFAYTKIEELGKRENENYYGKYIKDLRCARLKKQAERNSKYSYDDTNIGLQPGSGLKSPVLSDNEVEEESAPKEIKDDKLLSTRNIADKEEESLRKVLQGLKSNPSTPDEKQDCSLSLTPKQIHQVVIGPSILNYGEVCMRSTSSIKLHIINMLPVHVWVHLDIDFQELQKTKQLSYVIPPKATTYVSMMFQSLTLGKFCKSFTFRVNNMPSGHILVKAVVQPVKLALSVNDIVLKPHGFCINSGFRGTVQLLNSQNYFARFTWRLVGEDKGGAFTVCPAEGVVEAFSTLECEVKWKPSFSSPDKGEFILQVHEGNTMILKCAAHVGHTRVVPLEPRILFSNSPQGLTTWKKTVLYNEGQNHAYFKVCEQSLLPILNIFPSEGIIPFGGLATLNISCTPRKAEKFDSKAKIAIRHSNVIELRIGGSTEIADVEIVPNTFNFYGAYLYGIQSIPFEIKNKGITRARVQFDLKEFEDFSMDLKNKSADFSDPEFPYKYCYEIKENTALECSLSFSPKEVLTHNFIFQVKVNYMDSSENYIKFGLPNSNVPRTEPLIPPCYVQATVLQESLAFSSLDILFEIPLYALEPPKKVTRSQEILIENISKQNTRWTLDLSDTGKLFKDGIFKFSAVTGHLKPYEKYSISLYFSPKMPKTYTVEVPILLNDNPVCFRKMYITGEVKSPKLSFDPPFVFFTPVPLGVTTVVDINILPQNYFRSSTLSIQVPSETVLEDEIFPLAVKFPKGKVIQGTRFGINSKIPCQLSFRSSKPVSFFTKILFGDGNKNWFSLPVTATADNCILTTYPYIAYHLDSQKIIIKSGMEVSYEHLKFDKIQTLRRRDDGTVIKEKRTKQFFFPEEGTKAFKFFQNVVNATEIWFSLFGWSHGPHTLSIPQTIRRDVFKIQVYSSNKYHKKISKQHDFSKRNKTIYDVLLHLSGKLPPGVNLSQSLPMDNPERLMQLHLQHAALLNYLTAHGAYISHILPEFLFEPEDYKTWIEITSSGIVQTSSYIPKEKTLVIDDADFEALSKRAWTDVLLQIYKVLVLSRVTPHKGTSTPPIQSQTTQRVNPCFISSNVYSTSERILLSWLNTNYENGRHIVWKKDRTGVIPSEKWIINFDKDLMDGLVIATQMAAYCPFLIESHFVNMYLQPKNREQYLHNSLIILDAFNEIGFDMDLQAVDIYDPNPILMLMLCIYMYERLPTYLPQKVVPFSCSLHESAITQILLKNTSTKILVYSALIVGRDASDFSLTETGNIVTISPKNQINIAVKFTSRFIHPAEASLILISKPKDTVAGATLCFGLRGDILNFKDAETIKCSSPCYQWKEIVLHVKNPFETEGVFNVILVESSTFVTAPSRLNDSGQFSNRMNQGDAGRTNEHRSSECLHNPQHTLKTSIRSTFIKEFFCSSRTLELQEKECTTLEFFFLPFDIHVRYCVIILSNPKIGELLYIVEGQGLMPLPSRFFPVNCPSPIDYSETPEEVHSKEEPVLYLNCNPFQVVDMELKLPLANEAREKALAFAAQQQMSDLEYDRRTITGTLQSSSVRVAVAILGLTMIETCMLFSTSKLKKPKSILYTAEASLSEYFHIPKTISIPQISENPDKLKKLKPLRKKAAYGYVSVPLQFAPVTPGRFPCKISLTSRQDIRVYYVEGIVNDIKAEAKFEFDTPAFEPITQKIPVSNNTSKEWKCLVTIEGEGFQGHPVVHVPPGETIQYMLTFSPIVEGEVMGKLILQNETDGMKHVFDLRGIGRKPRAVEKVVVECQVGDVVNKTIMVTNYTRNPISYKVTSDLPIVGGDSDITIQPECVVPYVLQIAPWKRGVFRGALTFTLQKLKEIDSEEGMNQALSTKTVSVLSETQEEEEEEEEEEEKEIVVNVIEAEARSEETEESEETTETAEEEEETAEASAEEKASAEEEEEAEETASEEATVAAEEEAEEKSSNDMDHLKVWYYLEIHSSPGPPLRVIDVRCVALETICIDIPLTNPKYRIVHMEVKLPNDAFSGLKRVSLNPQENKTYHLRYSPATSGRREESIIFQPDVALEFWYLLRINTDSPKSTTMPEIKCELGKCVVQTIPLTNPTHETLVVEAVNNNPGDFILDIDPKCPLTIQPYTTSEVAVYFHPSGLGRMSHKAVINFSCSQFKDWKFFLTGVGLFPEPLKTEHVTTFLHLQSSVVIHFTNPTHEDVFINVSLTNQESFEALSLDPYWNDYLHHHSAFRFSSMSSLRGLVVFPKGSIDIPVLFVPRSMKLYKTMVVLQVLRANGKYWSIDNFDELDKDTKRTMRLDKGQVRAIYWLYPIVGLPQAPLPKDPAVVIKCQAKKRVEELVEISLTGEFFGKNPIKCMTEIIVVPKRPAANNYHDHLCVPGIREFQYNIEYESEALKATLESCIALYLIKTVHHINSETITMIFNMVFSPKKPLRTQVILKLECQKDGIWRFPIILHATEPDVDDIINIEGIGLFKEAVVNFTLTSQTRNPEQYTAYFLPGSDLEFSVRPEVGELPPNNTSGAVINVGFTPQMYSRKYKATLVIQTADMYWLYEINGLPQRTKPPRNVQAKIDASNKTYSRRRVHRRNFLRENANLTSTGVSSTIKGAPLIHKFK
ncbi:cilia- and flagella-associated protein 47 [Tenrec ecaudatus]|uniref:cilia- and flagella-associated protein 47 n=1 Tax=Tenrec ecaudatus TaxID=94439 RepID=UPI003F597390